MTAFERDKSGSTRPRDGFTARCTSLGEQLTETAGAIGFVLSRRKFLTRQNGLTVCTHKTFTMPRLECKLD